MRGTQALAMLAVLGVLTACEAGEPSGALGYQDELASQAAGITIDHTAVLTFQADWNTVTTNPPLLAGGTLVVNYAPERLPNCRSVYNGMETFTITMYWRAAPDATVHTLPLARYGTVMRGEMPVPEAGTELELWFENRDRQGCVAWDSNFDRNYRFAISPPVEPSDVTFTAGWEESAATPIRQGGLMRIVYAPERLRACRATYAGGRAWNILAGWRFLPGGETGSVALFDGGYYDGEAAVRQPDVAVPEGATAVEMWFSNSDRAGCVAWDSNFGDNYRFEVLPKGAEAPKPGWAGDFDFVIYHRDPGNHFGDADPAYYWSSWEGGETVSWVEVQVWIPGVTDQAWGSREAARSAAESRIVAEAVTDALPGTVDGWGTRPLEFLRQQGNNFVYAFKFWSLRYRIYNDPPLADGLYNYYVRFSTDGGATFLDAGRTGERTRRFVVANQQDCSFFPDNPPQGCPRDRTVGWVGNWGGRFSHACDHRDGLPDPVTFAKSSSGHDCMVIDAEVWVEGLTDASGSPSAVLAEVETDIGFSGGPLATLARYPLSHDGRVGNNYRYAWNLSEHVGRADRGDYRFRFRFSADGGDTWTTLGAGSGNDFRRLLVRNDSTDVEPIEHCEGIERWQGATNHQPDCVGYDVAAHHDANFCELYLNALGRGSMSHNSFWAKWLEAYVKVGPQDGTLLDVGMWTRYHDAAGTVGELLSLGHEIEPGYWLTGFTYEQSAGSGPDAQPTRLTVEAFSFFVDVQRPSGVVERLWQSGGGANYTLETAYAVPGYPQGIGIGSIEYADESVGLFDQKRACAE